MNDTPQQKAPNTWRVHLAQVMEGKPVQRLITVLILINAAILGLLTSAQIVAEWGWLLLPLDMFILAVFVIELALRFVARGPGLLRDPWAVFDCIVVGIALVPASGPFSVLRALRVLRVLRLVSINPSMRKVVQALLASLPGMGSIVMLMLLVVYVSAVMATQLFGERFPEWFGSLTASLYSLFQMMTLDSWSSGTVRPIMEVYPLAWLFFIPYVLIATFMMLNLFIAVIVNAMQDAQGPDAEAEARVQREQMILEELRALRAELAEMRRRS
ncbi:ion transporter [Phytopseudomonas dryadis]|uniref:Ion transporter n=1 Tax=Phytopseudomonas dryadis TaxID=2487520 RepID=A0A4V2KC63_9GAMM|nr:MULTISPECIES: ion transporter [Pseudomonas]TBU92062.1 ion transporter [Pseudomonas dryadis]TBV04358.1 ion transporter [Pseudomonas dryadis]TBV17084.1 ion transporter [Pseudomonas sp. FRB 230]